MLTFVRRLLVLVTIAAIVVFLLKEVSGTRLFKPSTTYSDTLSAGVAVLSSSASILATTIGVSLAVWFLSIQSGNRSNFGRAIQSLNNGKMLLLFLVAALSILGFTLISLLLLRQIISKQLYATIDASAIGTISVVMLLIPISLNYIESVSPLELSRRLTRKITSKSIWKYGLVQIEPCDSFPGRLNYRLRQWSQMSGIVDPLGAIHEVIMIAVEAKDRLLLAAMTRVMLGRIARSAGVCFNIEAPDRKSIIRSFWYKKIRKEPTRDALAITLHLLHYVIRRAGNLRKEWGDLDSVRQQYLNCMLDLIVAMARGQANAQVIDLCILSIYHIEMTYSDVIAPETRSHEALNRLFSIANELDRQKLGPQAALMVKLLRIIDLRTAHLRKEDIDSGLELLSASLSDRFRAIQDVSIISEIVIQSGRTVIDPWHEREKLYAQMKIEPAPP